MNKFPVLFLTMSLASCSQVPNEAYFDRGGPESLLNASSEYVTVSLASENALDELSGWVSKDQPTRAELYCQDGNPVCSQAHEALQQYGVPVTVTASDQGNAVLIYERLVARDCDPHYINDTINPYNLHHPAFGCALAANSLQMISDRQQITNPSLLDYPDAEHAAMVYENYAKPPTATTAETLTQLMSGGGGGGGGR